MLFKMIEVIPMDNRDKTGALMEWFMDIPAQDAPGLLEKWNGSLKSGIMELPPEISWGTKFISGPNKLGRKNEVGIYLISQRRKP